jgi:hypothetical protein
LSASSDTRGKSLQDLFIDWQSLIRQRASARQGTQERALLDGVYMTTLPIILQITEAVDDTEVIRLVQVASGLLREGVGV